MGVQALEGRCDIGADLFKRYAILLVLLAVALCGGMRGALAGDDAWSIVEAKGDVQVLRAGFQPVALTEGIVLRPGDRIVTTGNGRAIINRGKDTIIVAPNSEIGLPALKRPGWGTRIIQEIGTIFLKVESSAERRFEVETPVLAAVVKGTRFTVSANPMGAAVHVLEGAVEVSAFASQQTGMVMPGQTARLDSNLGSRLEIDGNEAPAGQEAESFERTLDTEEPESESTTLPLPVEIENADAAAMPSSTEPQTLSLEIETVEVSVTGEDATGAGTEQLAERQDDAVDAGPRAINVALGDTDINLRQVTRGLVRNAVIEPAGPVGESLEESAQTALEVEDSDDTPSSENAETTLVSSVEIDGEASDDTPSSENVETTLVSSVEIDGEASSIGSTKVEAATGLGLETMSALSDLDADGGSAAAAATTTGLGELPAGLDAVSGMPSGLGDDNSPTGIGDSVDITDTVSDIVDDIDDEVDDAIDDLLDRGIYSDSD